MVCAEIIDMNNIVASVVIPVKNAGKYLDLTLKRIFSQKAGILFEVIIIDSGLTGNSLEIVNRYPCALYQIPEKDFNHGGTRNYGILKSSGEYILFLSQDAVPQDDFWMQNLLVNLRMDDSVAGAYSRQVPCPEASALTRIRVNSFLTASLARRESRIDSIERYNKLSASQKHSFCNFDNVSSCIRRSVWQKIRLPETDFGEDIEWAEQVLKAGYKIIYEPKSVVYHSHNFTLWQWFHRNRANAQKLNQLFSQNYPKNIGEVLIKIFSRFYIDICNLICEEKKFSDFFCNSFKIFFYALIEGFGQYKGIQNSKRAL